MREAGAWHGDVYHCKSLSELEMLVRYPALSSPHDVHTCEREGLIVVVDGKVVLTPKGRAELARVRQL